MVPMLDTQRWLYATILDAVSITAAAGQVYADLIPQTGGYPAVVISIQASTPTYRQSSPQVRGWETVIALVKIITQGSSYAAIEPVASVVYEALQGGAGAGGTSQIRYCHRENQLPIPPAIVDGVEYRTLASVYRIQVYEEER